MRKTLAVTKREFTEMTRSKMFIVGTLFGPILMVGLFAFQILMFRSTGSDKSLVVLDGTTAGVGARVAEVLQKVPEGKAAQNKNRTRFHIEVKPATPADLEALQRDLRHRTELKQIDGYLWVPPGVLDSATVIYEGRSATNMVLIEQLRGAVQEAVQGVRLADQGIDRERLTAALKRVSLEARKDSGGAAQGSGTALWLLSYALSFVTYMVVMIFGLAVMRGVLEEKKDRIVEVVVSSMNARELMMGKVLGIGGASILQVAVWVLFVAVTLIYGGFMLAMMGVPGVHMPQVPGSVAFVFLSFFAGGFFLYAGIYAALGAMCTSDQDLQQLQMTPMFLLMFSFFATFRAMTEPEGTMARVFSWIPFSSPMVMPVRAAISSVSPLEVAGALATLVAGLLATIWLAGKIYRIGILSTGKRPSMAELVRWVKAA